MTPKIRAAVGALALALPVAGLAAPAVQADSPPAPVLQLKLPSQQVAYSDGVHVQSDFGARLIASGAPFELRIKRPDYRTPLRAYERINGADVPLPSTLPVTFNKLRHFLRLSFTPVDDPGATPLVRYAGACIGGTTNRIDPDAPATSSYPTYCYYNPFARGSLQGIQQGYAASVTNPWDDRGLKVPVGTYQLEVSVTGAWANALQVPAEGRNATTRVTIEKYPDVCGGDYRAARTARTAQRGCRATTPRATTARHTGPRPTPGRAVTPGELPAGTPLPDLRALPPTGFAITPDGDHLAFSATVWNGGTSPMVIDGFRRDGEDVMDGYQYFFGPDGQQLPDYVKVGTFEWDAHKTHQHWHFRQFAAYSLLPLGQVPQASGHAGDVGGVDSRKEAFCLANTDAVDLTGPNAAINPDNTDLSTACGDYTSLSTREVLAAGWGDTYAQFRAGQSFNLRNLANGCYGVWVEGNPVIDPATGERTLVESSTTNNRARRTVCIGGTPGHRTIRRVQHIGLVDDDGLADLGGEKGEY